MCESRKFGSGPRISIGGASYYHSRHRYGAKQTTGNIPNSLCYQLPVYRCNAVVPVQFVNSFYTQQSFQASSKPISTPAFQISKLEKSLEKSGKRILPKTFSGILTSWFVFKAKAGIQFRKIKWSKIPATTTDSCAGITLNFFAKVRCHIIKMTNETKAMMIAANDFSLYIM